jgi:uncharacterized phiE125 gp8 family phage protein
MAYKINTAPIAEPVTLDQAKAHLQVTTTDDDALISAFIVTARMYAESYTNRQLMAAIWDLYLDEFATYKIRLQKSPVVAVTEIAYKDSDGADATVDLEDIALDIANEPARLVPGYGISWPSTQSIQNAVKITFTAGYADADTVPAPIKSAMLLIVGHLYENRGDEGHRALPKSINFLLDPYIAMIFE